MYTDPWLQNRLPKYSVASTALSVHVLYIMLTWIITVGSHVARSTSTSIVIRCSVQYTGTIVHTGIFSQTYVGNDTITTVTIWHNTSTVTYIAY